MPDSGEERGKLVSTAVQFSSETVERLDHLAELRHTSRAAIVRELVENNLGSYERDVFAQVIRAREGVA